MGAFGPQPSVLLTVAVPRTGSEIDPTLLGSLFELTPAEVRLAAELMKGTDLAHAAAVQHLSITTIRSHLNAIFTKTNTHRQAELVELLLRVTSL
jgi:DNA-binding CsgD family transcriptional regulator